MIFLEQGLLNWTHILREHHFRPLFQRWWLVASKNCLKSELIFKTKAMETLKSILDHIFTKCELMGRKV